MPEGRNPDLILSRVAAILAEDTSPVQQVQAIVVAVLPAGELAAALEATAPWEECLTARVPPPTAGAGEWKSWVVSELGGDRNGPWSDDELAETLEFCALALRDTRHDAPELLWHRVSAIGQRALYQHQVRAIAEYRKRNALH